MSTLDQLKILYCVPTTHALYGLPFTMNEAVQQEPKHLWRAGLTKDWVFLSSPDRKDLTLESEERVRVWLAGLVETGRIIRIPCYPNEWCSIT